MPKRARATFLMNCCRTAANKALPRCGTSALHPDSLAWAPCQVSRLNNMWLQTLMCAHRLTSCC
eukprot:10413105-Alexandrium_andersonii.AAC.1